MVENKNVMSPSDFRKLRKKLGYTQGQLAAVWGVTGKSVGRWDRGDVPIPTLVSYCITLMVVNLRK